ncbi:MAG: hypothetical protein MAG451_01930 [Anaerolineales bacterium]|nr:hypothetical protein [Anaerolineales bacterium]
MTSQITLVLAILGVAVIFFVTDRLRMDVVALLVLAALALIGLVTADQALSGFSNPAVVTVWAVFILSGFPHLKPDPGDKVLFRLALRGYR